MGWGPRGLYEERTFSKLPEVTPEKGDILICKEWSNRSRHDGAKSDDLLYIRAGQALFSRMRRGSRNSEHAALCVATQGATRKVCEADGGGVSCNDMENRDMVVYRCSDVDLRNEAAKAALILTGQKKRAADGATLQAADYSWDKAKKAVFKSKKLMAKGRAYVEQLFRTVYEDDGGNPPAMFCSEFVTACYVLAAKRIEVYVPILDVDPRAISPKALESLLERSAGWFTKAGCVRFRAPAGAHP
jgi:hypothetical protein